MTRKQRERLAKDFLAFTKRYWRGIGKNSYARHTWDNLSFDNREYCFQVAEWIDKKATPEGGR